jgi:hypothetical protein
MCKTMGSRACIDAKQNKGGDNKIKFSAVLRLIGQCTIRMELCVQTSSQIYRHRQRDDDLIQSRLIFCDAADVPCDVMRSQIAVA